LLARNFPLPVSSFRTAWTAARTLASVKDPAAS
jgi:hypothetical protein